ncbi:glycoside hydrolase family 25 protein [Clostridium sp. 'deep sea']|uniref:glycoside hydrolase family 25 protein n=1 Tax=Clostridium sp. 'deep sea' TaxID=2779445 RepID=UPI0018968E7D|nr:glycoside hydrolase family 25 protein [Clostridium sp. 'deep sea']QOR35977.1 glycoside hydrolase family 25 protein [Clostridium sp. 'deep sea']
MGIYRKALLSCVIILACFILVFATIHAVSNKHEYDVKIQKGSILVDNVKVKLRVKEEAIKIVAKKTETLQQLKVPDTISKSNQPTPTSKPQTPINPVKPIVKVEKLNRIISDRGNFQRIIDNTSSEEILGIDISHHQSDRGEIEWKKVAESKVGFAFIKVSEGNTYKDPYAKRHFEGAREQGISAGGYHYARPQLPIAEDAKAEVAHFINRLKLSSNDYGDLPAVLDLEDPLYPGTNGLNTEDLLNWATIFCEEFEKYTGHKIIVYTGNWFINSWNNFNSPNNVLLKYPVWIADYYANRVPSGGWSSWFVWQFSDKGSIDGITGNVDLNISSKKLLTYCK